jgi:import inner membrane translocase subunit TIM23
MSEEMRWDDWLTMLMIIGLGAGGAWGLREGLTRNLGERSSTKLRLNSILNGVTRRGTLLGNSLGVLGESYVHNRVDRRLKLGRLAIFYNITNSTLDHFRGKHDVFNSLGAAAASGAIYKSTGQSHLFFQRHLS